MKIREYIKKSFFMKSCQFNDPKCLSKQRFGCICGKGGDSKPDPVDPTAEAQANLQAQQATLPGAAQTQYDILSNPNYGVGSTTQLYEDTRRDVYGGETQVRDQMLQNVLAELSSPTGITPEQQSFVDANRARAQSEMVNAIRTRENLGGNLYSGGAGSREGRLVGEMQGGFAEQDIAGAERRRNNALQQAMQSLQLLYPQAGIQAPQYINPVVSANQQYAGRGDENALAAQIEYQNKVNMQNQISSFIKPFLGGSSSGVGGGGGSSVGQDSGTSGGSSMFSMSGGGDKYMSSRDI